MKNNTIRHNRWVRRWKNWEDEKFCYAITPCKQVPRSEFNFFSQQAERGFARSMMVGTNFYW
jgi:hypothetical protein